MNILCLVLQFYSYVLIARVLLSWFPRVPDGLRPIVEGIYAVTEPLMRLVRPLIPPIRIGAAALDLSVLLIFFALQIITAAICR